MREADQSAAPQVPAVDAKVALIIGIARRKPQTDDRGFFHFHLGGPGLLPDLATGDSLLLVASIKNEASIIGVREQSEEPKNVTKLRESARNARSLPPSGRPKACQNVSVSAECRQIREPSAVAAHFYALATYLNQYCVLSSRIGSERSTRGAIGQAP